MRKHPEKHQTFELNYGKAHVFYPEAGEECCTVALLLEVDPVGLVRNRRDPAGEARTLEQYVNDRPYMASSFLSVAIADVFGSAMAGKAKERAELADSPLSLEATIALVPSRGGADLLKRLFEPLGYAVSAEPRILDQKFPDWGESPYFDLVSSSGTFKSRHNAKLFSPTNPGKNWNFPPKQQVRSIRGHVVEIPGQSFEIRSDPRD